VTRKLSINPANFSYAKYTRENRKSSSGIIKWKCILFITIHHFLQCRRENTLYESRIRAYTRDVLRESEQEQEREEHKEKERERGRNKNAYLTHDECSDTHHGATTSQRVPQNRATMRPLVAIMLKCNLLITAAAPSRGLISPICTAVGERKQNGNERPVCLAGWFGIKRATLGMQKGRRTDRDGEIERKRERQRGQWWRRLERYEKK